MQQAKVVIVGAGVAGAATAYQLARRGMGELLILEREAVPGMHSSGRSAAMIRQVIHDREIAPLSRKGAVFFISGDESAGLTVPFLRSGSILVGRGESLERLRGDADQAKKGGVEDVEVLDSRQVLERVPAAEGGDFEGGIFCPTDGVTDPETLIQGFYGQARKAGAVLRTGCAVEGIEVRDGKVRGVETSSGTVRAEVVVNAAGAWAGEVGRMAGAAAIEFKPLRRHIYYTGALDWVDPGWPFVWDVSHEVYFRPESSGLLISPCDETEAAPGLPSVDPEMEELLAEKLACCFPRLLDVPIVNRWAGLRTFAPDRRFVVGWDPLVEGFYWVAGLGGHGVTTCPAVGNLAAGEIISGATDPDSPHNPARFA